MKLAHSPGSGL
jgi:hypothetical protein